MVHCGVSFQHCFLYFGKVGNVSQLPTPSLSQYFGAKASSPTGKYIHELIRHGEIHFSEVILSGLPRDLQTLRWLS